MTALLDAAEALIAAVRDNADTAPAVAALNAEVARGRAREELAKIDAETARLAAREAELKKRRDELAAVAGNARRARRGTN